MKKKNDSVSIKVIYNYFDIDLYKESEKLNELYVKNDIAYYGFDLFLVKILHSIKCSYDSFFIFKSTRL